MSMTATQMMPRHDLRRSRAMSLASAVMQKVSPFLDAENGSAHRDAFGEIFELFLTEGVEVLTDFDRTNYGLPPRGPDGWTHEEVVALERLRLDMLLRPIRTVVDDIEGHHHTPRL